MAAKQKDYAVYYCCSFLLSEFTGPPVPDWQIVVAGIILLCFSVTILFFKLYLEPFNLKRIEREEAESAARKQHIERFEADAEYILKQIQPEPLPIATATPSPTESDRQRLASQIHELQLARDNIRRQEESPVELGKMLAECDAKISSLKKELTGINDPPVALEAPFLRGRALFDEAIARQTDNPTLYVKRALHFYNANDPKSAFADCERALKLLPNYPYALNTRGLLYEQAANYPAAIRDLRQAVTEMPHYQECFTNLARVYNAQRKPHDAIEAATHATDWSFLPAYEQLAIAYEQLGDLEKAVHNYTKIIQTNPNPVWAPYVLTKRAGLLFRLGQTELPIHDLETQLAIGPAPEALKLLDQIERRSTFSSRPASDSVERPTNSLPKNLPHADIHQMFDAILKDDPKHELLRQLFDRINELRTNREMGQAYGFVAKVNQCFHYSRDDRRRSLAHHFLAGVHASWRETQLFNLKDAKTHANDAVQNDPESKPIETGSRLWAICEAIIPGSGNEALNHHITNEKLVRRIAAEGREEMKRLGLVPQLAP